ncbi:hypothetical protein V7S43_007456 [Phytophthora oleae]|uniref:PiggyBac transposable element-derived protein domain-containing protein n=1 Tax=Phytophthora oleae TaxID=2107226 RepID=A0ABD3FLA6_9STRA
MTSLSRAAFTRLLVRFAEFYEIPRYNPKGGRPRKLQQHHQVLGLLLAYYLGSMQNDVTLQNSMGGYQPQPTSK